MASENKPRCFASGFASKRLMVVILSALIAHLPGFYQELYASIEHSYAPPRNESVDSATTASQNDAPLLEAEKPIDRAMQGGETHLYRLTVNSGQYLRVVVNQQGIDVAVALIQPDGKRILDVDSPNGKWGNEPVSIVAEASGEYRIEVRSPKAPPGRYEIKLEALRHPSESDLARVAAEREFYQTRKLAAQPSAQAKRDAIAKFEQVLSSFRSLEDRAMEMLTLNLIGLIHHFLRDLQNALDYYNNALALSRAIGDRAFEAAMLNNIGGVYDILAEPHKALGHFDQALSIFEALGDSSEQGNTQSNIAIIYANLGERQKALEYYNKALPLIRKVENMRREAIILDNIGQIYIELGEPQRAMEYHQRALELRRIAKDPRSEARSLQLIGYAHSAMDHLSEALKYYDQALALQRTVGDKSGEALTLNLMALAHSSLGELQRSLEYRQQSLQLLQAVGDRRREAYTLARIGQDYISLGQPDKALEYCRQALSLAQTVADRAGQAIALHLLAHAERDKGNLADARKHIEDAISRVSAMRADLDSRTFRTSYFAREQGSYEFYIDLLMRMHNRSPSEGHDAAALAISEQARARSLLETLSEARIDIRQGVDASLLARERELSQRINAKAARLIQALGQQNAKERAASLNKEISELEDHYQQAQAAVRKASPQYAALTQPQPLTAREIQQLLDEETLLLQYSVGDERSYLWAVTKDSIKSYELPKREVIKKAARRVYDLLTARSLRIKEETAAQRRQRITRADAQLLQAAAELSEIVIGPAASELRGKRLVVVPDGELHYVPFAVLPAPLANQVSNAQEKRNNKIQTSNQSYRPLIASHEIVSLPSASAFAEHRKSLAGRKPAERGVAIIADPVFSSDDERLKARPGNNREHKTEQPDSTAAIRLLEHAADNNTVIARLPFTRREAEEILSVAPSQSSFKAVDFKATRAAATNPELSKYRYVHFATHGHLNTEHPDSSGIVLSMVDERGQSQPGMLMVREIYNLKLPAELVVLSACETGLGKEFRGEGLWGLTRGFMYAGAARVVVGLWSVNDRATSELMARFYKAMLKDNQRPAAALRTAQVEMWRQKQWQSPYYWAAFTLQGEWR